MMSIRTDIKKRFKALDSWVSSEYPIGTRLLIRFREDWKPHCATVTTRSVDGSLRVRCDGKIEHWRFTPWYHPHGILEVAP